MSGDVRKRNVIAVETVVSDCSSQQILDSLSDASSPTLMFQALLLGIGLQHKSVEQLEKEIELPSSQLMGLFNRLVRKFVQASL